MAWLIFVLGTSIAWLAVLLSTINLSHYDLTSILALISLVWLSLVFLVFDPNQLIFLIIYYYWVHTDLYIFAIWEKIYFQILILPFFDQLFHMLDLSFVVIRTLYLHPQTAICLSGCSVSCFENPLTKFSFLLICTDLIKFSMTPLRFIYLCLFKRNIFQSLSLLSYFFTCLT